MIAAGRSILLFFTSRQGQPKTAVRDQTRACGNADPDLRADREAIREPSRDFSDVPRRALALADSPE